MLPPFQGDFGGAYLLRTRAAFDAEIRTAEFVVRIRANAPFATVEKTGTVASADVRNLTWNALQEAFDLQFTKTRKALATQSGEREYLTWYRAPNGYDVTYSDTVESVWSMSGTIVGGGPPAPEPAPPQHHPALRFYRLSQVSDDLFDSYRNAYLDFECLISGESAKQLRERELDWLIRVSKASFSSAIPGGINIEQTLRAIYELGRLPLFHAKMSETFFTPQGDEREHLHKLLDDLTFLLISFLGHKLGHSAVGGWGLSSQGRCDAQSRTVFDCDAVMFQTGRYRTTVVPIVDVYDNPRRFGNLWARIAVHPPQSLPSLSKMETLLKRQARIHFELEEAVSLTGVSTFAIELCVVNMHASAPRRLHSA